MQAFVEIALSEGTISSIITIAEILIGQVIVVIDVCVSLTLPMMTISRRMLAHG